MVDFNEKSVQLNPRNILKVKKWTGSDDDRSLLDLALLLKGQQVTGHQTTHRGMSGPGESQTVGPSFSAGAQRCPSLGCPLSAPLTARVRQRWPARACPRVSAVGASDRPCPAAVASSGVSDVREVMDHYRQFDDPLEAFRENQRRLQVSPATCSVWLSVAVSEKWPFSQVPCA